LAKPCSSRRRPARSDVVFDYADRWEASVAKLAEWVRAGKLRYSEDVLDVIEACPDALAGLYRGENRGKRLIRLTK
jgi:NADPH-dependent curcumin reductase